MTTAAPLYRMQIRRSTVDDPRHVQLGVQSTLAFTSDEVLKEVIMPLVDAGLWTAIFCNQTALLATLTIAMQPWIEYERQEHGCGRRARWKPFRHRRYNADNVLVETDEPINPSEWVLAPTSDHDYEACSIYFEEDADGLPEVYFYVPRNTQRDWCTRINAALTDIATKLAAT